MIARFIMKSTLLAALGALLFLNTGSLFASAIVNGFGYGTVALSVWCAPAAPPGAPTYAAGGGPALGASASLGPGLAGCNPITNIGVTLGAFWQAPWTWAEGPGDKVAGDGADANALALFSELTPTSLDGSGSLDVSGSETDADDVLFTGTYSLSDAGQGFSIEWYSADTGTELASISEIVGAASGSISKSVFDALGYSDIEMETDVAGETLSPTPEAGTFVPLLVGAGFFAAGLTRRRRAAARA
jgi:hypothetical protein